MPASAAAAPACTNNANPTVFAKTSKKVEQILLNRAAHKGDTIRIRPSRIGVHQCNRKGQSPSMQYIHGALTNNVKKDGFDAKRARPGIVVEMTSQSKLTESLDFNRKIADYSPGLWPAIDAEIMKFFTLSFTHMTIKLRLHEAGHVCEATGQSFVVDPKEDPDLAYVVSEGHEYIVLSEDTTPEEAQLISDWYNSDQDQNNSSSEASLIRTIQLVVQELQKSSKIIKTAQVIQKVTERSIVKVNPSTIGYFAKFVIDLGGADMVDEWLTHFAVAVNPCELACPPSFFNELAAAFGVSSPLTKVNIAQVVYDGSVVERKPRPIPDTCKFITGREVELLCKDVAKVTAVETFLRNNRLATQAVITTQTSHQFFITALRPLEHNVVRLALGKTLLKSMPFPKSVLGKFSEEKLITLQSAWLQHLQSTWSHLATIAKDAGIDIEVCCDAECELPAVMQSVAVNGFKVSTEAPPAITGGLKIGDEVELIKRITVEFNKESGVSAFRKDVNAGEKLFIVDTEANGKDIWPVVEIIKHGDDGKVLELKTKLNPKNLKPASTTCVPGNPAASSDKDTNTVKPPKGVEFIGYSPTGTIVTVHKEWPKRVAGKDEDTAIARAKDVVGFSLGAVLAQLPQYSAEDLIVVEQACGNNSTTSVYTGRDFEANTLVLGPDTLEVKDRYYTQGRASYLRGGDSVHPKKKDLVLDGRLRSRVTGLRPVSLFFVVDRLASSDDGHATMKIQYANIEVSAKITLPTKRKLSCLYKEGNGEAESPNVGIPIMFNAKAIKKHTKLTVHTETEISRIEEKEKKAKVASAKKAARDDKKVN